MFTEANLVDTKTHRLTWQHHFETGVEAWEFLASMAEETWGKIHMTGKSGISKARTRLG